MQPHLFTTLLALFYSTSLTSDTTKIILCLCAGCDAVENCSQLPWLSLYVQMEEKELKC